ncbi:MAG: glycine--tRNA ligase subunit beta [Acidobacteria bacterium]|nr:MAG: glycine--tRNA ligase subunit beta [Acidobacteriota bacterium]
MKSEAPTHSNNNTKREFAQFFLEVGCEEIPAGMICGAAKELQIILNKYLALEKLTDGTEVIAFGAPRRLVATCPHVWLKQEDIQRQITGPPKSAAFDGQNAPTRVAQGFAAKYGVGVEKLFVVSTPRGEYVAVEQLVAGRAAAERLAEIVPRAIAEIPWPKTMYWTGASGLRFIRPIRWVVALLGGRALRLEIAGVAAGAATTGHRFLGKSSIAVSSYNDYLGKLEKNYVLALPAKRHEKVDRELSKLAAGKGLRVHADAALLELVVYLNEYPSAILGNFDPTYLELPEEILITVMRDHQKYFALRRRDGRLAPNFLAVINLDRDAKGLVCAGHERVLRARFADAKFFWELDQKCRLADYLPKLASVVFQAKLGSYGEKVERIRALSRWFAEQWFARGIQQARVAHADRAAELAKCDLVTGLVREFTELQGIVGGLYAKAQGEPEEVCWAVYDHYRPTGLDEPTPRNLTGATVSIADKLDTLVGCFAVGLAPTGSSDPFGLRRAGLGVVKIILERKLPVSLSESISAAARGLFGYSPKLKVTPEIEKSVGDFLVERARYVFLEREGFAYDEINAVLAAGADDLVDAQDRIAAVREIRKTRNFEPLAVSFKRVRKILEKAGSEKKWRFPAVRPELFQEEAERKLHAAAHRVAAEAQGHKKVRGYREALQGIAKLRPEVDEFFDRVLVMAEQEDIRRNRLTLLAELLSEFSTIADFSEIVAAEK